MNRHARRSFAKRVRDAVVGFTRGYEGASASGRFPWRQTMPAPTSEGLAAAPILGQRIAHFVVNDPHGAAILNAYCTDIVGDAGPSLQHDDPAVVDSWNDWWSRADAEGISSLGHLLIRLMRSFVVYGESFTVLKVSDDGELRLLLLPVAQVDQSYNEDLAGEGWVISGIHVARDGHRLRYRVLLVPPDHPFASEAASATWIDAVDICHAVDPLFAGAVRGISPLAAALTRSVETDLLISAQLRQQQVSALLNVFLSDPSGSVSLGDVFDRDKVELVPGQVRLVPPDTVATVVQPPEARGGIDFTKHMLRSMAAAVGLPAWKVSADLGEVNFSSARMGDFAWRRRVSQLQRLIEQQFLNVVFRRFIALEVAASRLAVDLDTLADPAWIWPAPPMIDPKAEVESDQIAVAAGFISRQSVVSKYGRDPQEVAREIEADNFTPAAPPPPTPQPTLKVVQNAQ